MRTFQLPPGKKSEEFFFVAVYLALLANEDLMPMTQKEQRNVPSARKRDENSTTWTAA